MGFSRFGLHGGAGGAQKQKKRPVELAEEEEPPRSASRAKSSFRLSCFYTWSDPLITRPIPCPSLRRFHVIFLFIMTLMSHNCTHSVRLAWDVAPPLHMRVCVREKESVSQCFIYNESKSTEPYDPPSVLLAVRSVRSWNAFSSKASWTPFGVCVSEWRCGWRVCVFWSLFLCVNF